MLYALGSEKDGDMVITAASLIINNYNNNKSDCHGFNPLARVCASKSLPLIGSRSRRISRFMSYYAKGSSP